MTPVRLTLVVARARNGIIGLDGRMPWHLPEELRHFKATTMGHAMIMGRRTFDSIGRALPGRESIVVTRDPDWAHPGCHRAASLDDAIAIVQHLGRQEAMVIGGAQVYAQALPRADRLVMTEIDLSPPGDTSFPAPDEASWICETRTPHRAADGTAFTVCEYRRR